MKQFLVAAFVLCPMLCFATYYSEKGQDKVVHLDYFEGYRSGVFVDIGAYNGVTDSHSCFFERELGWTGLCVEPIPNIFDELKANRICTCIQGCVANRTCVSQFLKVTSPDKNTEMLSGLIDKFEPRHMQRIHREIGRFGGSSELIDMKCYTINDLLAYHGISHINLLILETEGSEFDILSTFNFARHPTDVILVGDHYGDKRFIPFLASKGFYFVDRLHQDLLFVHQDFKSEY